MRILKTNKKLSIINISSKEKKKIIKQAIVETNKEQLEVVSRYYKKANVAN